MLTQEKLKSILKYNAETGEWSCASSRGKGGSKLVVGDKAGTLRKDGRWQISIEGKLYMAHRLAWLYMTGTWPVYEIDHKDCNPSNNAWSNLREATRVQNSANQGLRKNNKSGAKGVHWREETGKYMVRIRIGGKRIYLGEFECLELANLVYSEYAEKHFGNFARVA